MRRRILTTGTAVLTAAAAVLSGCGTAKENQGGREAETVREAGLSAEDFESWNALLNENEITPDFQEALREFAFDSGSAVLSGQEENAVFSPLSLYYALAVLGTGAAGETGEELLKALGAEDAEELAEECGKLYRGYVYSEEWEKVMGEEYEGESPDSTIRLANSLWISQDLNLKQEYLDTCAEDFFASSYYVDFTDPKTGEQMGEWIGEQTEGVLTPRLELKPETLLAILNTLYFYGGWRDTFDEALTAEDSFTLEDGSQTEVPFMNRTDSMGSYIRGEGYTMAGLFTDHDCEMLFVLPDEGVEVQSLLEDPENMKEIFTGAPEEWTSGKIIWKVPKFSFGSSFELPEILKEMGMETMFDGAAADFSLMSDRSLFVDQVIQEAHIGVDEEGVEGAAYTMLALSGSAALQDEPEEIYMTLDRPFLFGIYDYKNDVWLFLGVCMDPSAES